MKLLLVDDHQMVRLGLKSYFEYKKNHLIFIRQFIINLASLQ